MDPLEKKFLINPSDLKQLIPPMGNCLATDRILVDGEKVGFMYREETSSSILSGWVFLSGDEEEDYVNNSANWAIHEVNTICNYDASIIPYLKSDYGSAFGRDFGEEEFEREPMPGPNPE